MGYGNEEKEEINSQGYKIGGKRERRENREKKGGREKINKGGRKTRKQEDKKRRDKK